MVNDTLGFYSNKIIERHQMQYNLTASWAEHINFTMSLYTVQQDKSLMQTLHDEYLAHKMFDL